MPLLEAVGALTLHVEANASGFAHIDYFQAQTFATTSAHYVDPGALCTDWNGNDISESVVVNGEVGFPDVATCATYEIEYHCANAEGTRAVPVTRDVVVVDNTCPICSLLPGPEMVEASFPYHDPGVNCVDSVDGECGPAMSCITTVDNRVDTQQVGTYTVVYRARDSFGNWNDENCNGHSQYVRTVEVVDTLKPVIALHMDGSLVHVGDSSDTAIHSSSLINPAGAYHQTSTQLMAEVEPTSINNSWNWATMGLVAALSAAALLSFSRSRTEETMANPENLPL
jgi:hypothetical protein